MAEDEAFFSRKGEKSKPLKSRREVFQRGFPHPVKSKME
jgi:hypothetical protein